MDEHVKKQIIDKIKQKKELSGIPDSFVEGIMEKHSKKYFSIPISEPIFKDIVKSTRSELRKYVGRFRSSVKSREKMLENNDLVSLLKTHSSTKERLLFYPILKEKILSLKPKSILDLACGINPLAIAEKNIKYYAFDINEKELQIVEAFFKKNGINGKIFVQDITEDIEFPEADLCLILKILDILDDKGHKKAEAILKKLKCRHILVSFSLKTLSGRPMNHSNREWFTKILTNLKYPFSTFKSDNEIFYLIEKI